MTLLAKLGQELPERYYLGLDVGYREHVAVVISLQTFVRGKERWQQARCLHFESTSGGLAKLQRYLDRQSTDPQAFLGLCEPTGGYYGVVVFEYLQAKGYPMQWLENATTRHMRQQIFGDLPKTDEVDARVMARIGYLHEAVGEEFTLRPVQLAAENDSDLLALCRLSWKLNVMINRAQNQLTRCWQRCFRELKSFFTDSVATMAPVRLVAAYRTPAELAAAGADEVAAVLHRAGAHKHAKRVAELQELAACSAGVLPNQGGLAPGMADRLPAGEPAGADRLGQAHRGAGDGPQRLPAVSRDPIQRTRHGSVPFWPLPARLPVSVTTASMWPTAATLPAWSSRRPSTIRTCPGKAIGTCAVRCS